MTLMRWEPKSEIDAMRRTMDRMFNQVMNAPLFSRLHIAPQDGSIDLIPNVEVCTTDTDVVVSIELPGINPEDVSVEIAEDSVHVSGEVKSEAHFKEDNYYRTERQYGAFDRLVPLPNRVKEQEAKAGFKNGVLTIRAPLAEVVKRPQARKLSVSH